MILIRFPDQAAERQALGYLPGRFAFKSSASGDMLVQDEALPFLAQEGVSFMVHGPARYEQSIPTIRNSAATSI